MAIQIPIHTAASGLAPELSAALEANGASFQPTDEVVVLVLPGGNTINLVEKTIADIPLLGQLAASKNWFQKIVLAGELATDLGVNLGQTA